VVVIKVKLLARGIYRFYEMQNVVSSCCAWCVECMNADVRVSAVVRLMV
jgi:hypothetical protein